MRSRRPGRRIPSHLLTVVLAMFLPGCASLRYYAHVTHGQLQLLAHRRPIERIVRDPHTDPALAARLRLALEARAFATRRLELPDNRSYTLYVRLDRPYVAWNVFATPPFAVDAIPQCFPIAGCVAYRGYFDPALARARAARLRAQGDDVWVGPVAAYSTLGWFADPIVSSMLRWDDDELAGTIFHELAHQKLYLRGDTAFNESYATFVQQEGLREWRALRELPPADGAGATMAREFTALVLDLRERLRRLYAGRTDAGALARGKQAQIDAFRARYRAWRTACWPGDHRYDAWVAAPINNARLLPFGLYDRWTAAFAALFGQVGRQWPAFHGAVRALARLSPARREQALRELAATGAGADGGDRAGGRCLVPGPEAP